MRTDRFLDVDGVELHYSEWGNSEAPPVVCLHGLSRVGRDFDPLAAELESDYRVLCPDLPGRGLSEWTPARYAPTAMIELLVGFCDALELPSLRVVGTSMGGSLGMRLAAGSLSDRIDALVVNDVGPGPEAASEDGIERILEYLTDPPTYDRFSEMEAHYRRTYATFSEMTDAEWRRLTRTSSRRTDDGRWTPNYDTRIVEPVLRSEPDVDGWATWDAIEVPTLVIRGTDSDILEEGAFEEMQRRRPAIETLEIDCGHAPALNVEEQIEPIRSLFETVGD
ncbi:MAG: alpha/beta hydrolase [Natronomonas sp.]